MGPLNDVNILTTLNTTYSDWFEYQYLWRKLYFAINPDCLIKNSPHVSSSIGKKSVSSPFSLNSYRSKPYCGDGIKATVDGFRYSSSVIFRAPYAKVANVRMQFLTI